MTTYQESAESYTHKVLPGVQAQEHVDMMTQTRHTGSDTMAQISTIVQHSLESKERKKAFKRHLREHFNFSPLEVKNKRDSSV